MAPAGSISHRTSPARVNAAAGILVNGSALLARVGAAAVAVSAVAVAVSGSAVAMAAQPGVEPGVVWYRYPR